ncbi:S-layer homology domain-containing protein [Bacillus cereus]|uniref:Cell wall hydrolase n=1 Tax=Bacillus cereus TaxID=1396 RepID=A0A9X7BDD2_BACCE|nr:S-layer homology domain-containing protein [Bacillus cereus]PED40339.1 cell wall hydrolase [Bacillus cereus]PFV08312.1 cell wall hydrolase [Bacillus cereus]
MKNKLIAAGIVTGTLLSYSSNIFADTLRFQDVPKWAEQSVNYLVDKHVINGLPNGTFGSYETLDRASAVTIITKALGVKINQNVKSSFKDVQGHWGAPYIAAAEKAGIVKGVGNGLFNPSEKVTRAAMATMLVNAYKLQSPVESEGKTKFKDLEGHWGEKAANILIDLGISNGTDNGWQPDRIVTRVEAAQLTAKVDMLQNRGEGTLNNLKKETLNKKKGRMDGVVSSIVRDSNGDYIKVNYKGNDGKEKSAYVLAPKKHDFKEGDKVKIGWGREVVYHKNFGWKTIQYNNVNSKSEVYSNSKFPITKVNEKQNEQFEIGEIEDIWKDESEDFVQVRLKDSESKKQYVDIPVPQGHSYKKGEKVKVANKGEWEKQINNSLMTVWLGQEGTISKIIENEKQNEDFVIGEIYNAEKNHVSVKYLNNKGQTNYVHIDITHGHDFKDGDKVKVINKKNWNGNFAQEGSILKFIENEKQNEDFVIGEIYNAEKNHVSVKYLNNKGQTNYVHIDITHGHDFKDGDKVKVSNKKNWNGNFAQEGSISKVND